jgi:hypothetical protein
MDKLLKSVDWSKVLSYGWHLGLLAGSIALQAYAPHSAQIWLPVMQAAGQLSPQPEGVTLLNKA